MFSRGGQGASRGPRRPKKETGSKKDHIRSWMRSKEKKKNEANLFAVMMSSGDPQQAQTSISTTGFDTIDDARLGKITPTLTKKTLKSTETDAEAIEEVMPIVQTTLPMPEPKPKIERNGIDVDKKKPPNQSEDDACIVNCIYFTQQCCECTIV